jgi:diguanylate cyclase (GGDEF)-like protein
MQTQRNAHADREGRRDGGVVAALRDPRLKRKAVSVWRGPAACLLVLLAAPVVAADPTSLREQVDRLEDSDASASDFAALLARVEREGDSQLLADLYMRRCQSLLGGDVAEAARIAALGIPLATQAKADEALAGLLVCRGYLAEQADQLEPALADYQQAFEVSQRLGDLAGMAQAQALRGEIHYLRGNVSDALNELLEAYRLSVESGSATQLSYTLNAIANLYADPRVGQYRQALDCYSQLLVAHQRSGKQREAATTEFNIGSTLQIMGEHSEAEASFRRALAAYTTYGDHASVAETQRALAILYNNTQRPAEALALANAALAYAEQHQLPHDAAAARLTAGSALRLMGQFEQAAEALAAARRYFERRKSPRFLERVLGERAEVEAARQDWEAAYEARSDQLEVTTGMATQLNEELTSRLRVQFDSEHKEQENAALQREASLREQALRNAERIRELQTAVIGLGAALLLGLAGLAMRAVQRARRMRALALTDELTGLPNRRAILQQLSARMATRGRSAAPLLMFDIDHFKSINDRLGHDVGDVVLKAVAISARRAIAGHGEVGRIGGEEFLVLLRPAEADYLGVIAERLRKAIEDMRLDGASADLRVTISVGGSLSSPADTRIEDVLKRVDLALYRAKEGGRNRVELDGGAKG